MMMKIKGKANPVRELARGIKPPDPMASHGVFSNGVKQKVYNFTAVFEPAEEGGYIVYVPALPGCATQGETFEEAEDMIKDAVRGYLLTLRDLREAIPSESDKLIIAKIPATLSL